MSRARSFDTATMSLSGDNLCGGCDDAATHRPQSLGHVDVAAQRIAVGHQDVVVALVVRHDAVLASGFVGAVVPGRFEVLRGEPGVAPRGVEGDDALAQHGQGDGHALDARHECDLHGEVCCAVEEAVEDAVEEEAVIRISKAWLYTGTRYREKIGPQYTRRHRLIEKIDNRFVRDEQCLEHGGMTTPIPLSHSQQNVRDRVDRGTRCFGVGED